jgi:carbon monoxide dehydrogenase subunit G
MKAVRTSIEIAAPPERVWDVLMDPDRLGEWVTIHKKLGDVSDRPLKRGATIDQTLTLRGTSFKVKWKIAEFDRPTHAVWKGKGPAGSQAKTQYDLSKTADGNTLFHYVNEFKTPLGPLGSAAGQLVVGDASKREAERTLAQLKALVESENR